MKILLVWFGLVIALSARAELNDNEYRCASALDNTTAILTPGVSHDRAGKGFIASGISKNNELVLWGKGYTYFCKIKSKSFTTVASNEEFGAGVPNITKVHKVSFKIPSEIQTKENDGYNIVGLRYFDEPIGDIPLKTAYSFGKGFTKTELIEDKKICSQKHDNDTQNVIWSDLKNKVEKLYLPYSNLYSESDKCTTVRDATIAALRACANIPLVKSVIPKALTDFSNLCPTKSATDSDNSSSQGGAPK